MSFSRAVKQKKNIMGWLILKMWWMKYITFTRNSIPSFNSKRKLKHGCSESWHQAKQWVIMSPTMMLQPKRTIATQMLPVWPLTKTTNRSFKCISLEIIQRLLRECGLDTWLCALTLSTERTWTTKVVCSKIWTTCIKNQLG